MAQRHWLDPLARQLLIATGQLRRPSATLPVARAWMQMARQVSAAVDPRQQPKEDRSPQASAEAMALQQQEVIERELLALQLLQRPERRLRSAEEVERAASLGWRLDVNRATTADWLRLPGCTTDQADLLQRLQAGGVQLSGPEDLQRLLQLDEALLRSWLPLLVFRWYGSPPDPAPAPLAINAAAAQDLRRLGGLEEDRLALLLQERSRRPFRDLADLQQRLALPAAVIESWIGRLSFEPPPPGPRLPRASRRPGR